MRPFWYGTDASGGVQLSTQVLPVYTVGDTHSPGGGAAAAEAMTFSITDTLFDTAPIPAPGPLYDTTHFAFLKQLALEVVTPAVPASTLSNAAVRLYTDLGPGMRLFYRANSSFIDQSVTGAAPADLPGVDELLLPLTPAGYQVVTTLATPGRVYTDDVSLGVWDVMGTFGNGGTIGRVSNFLDLVLGITHSVTFLPDTFPRIFSIVFTYSELAQAGA